MATAEDGAELKLGRPKAGRWTLHYRPARQAIEIASRGRPSVIPVKSRLLVEADERTDVVVTYPLNTTATSPSFLEPKYDTLRTITFDQFGLAGAALEEDELRELFQRLPSGFVKDPFFGLGLNFDIRHIAKTVEEISGVVDLCLRRGRSTNLPTVKGGSYVVSARQFDDVRKAINRIHNKALNVATDEKWMVAHNSLLSTIDSTKFPVKNRTYRKDAIREAVGASVGRGTALSKSDQKIVFEATVSAARTIQRTQPESLLKLSREIEIVTLEELAERLRKMLARKLNEGAWQSFFTDNPFVLRLAFGHPIMMIGGQISVGGRKFSGAGDKISDFVIKAAASGNLGLIEIKTPDTLLIEKTPYRGDLHAPSRELTGAVNQILDQRHHLQKSIPALKDNSGAWDVQSYAIQGLVIAGRIPEGAALLKSFELFRNALKSVTIITFDELGHKLEHLLEVLGTSNAMHDEKLDGTDAK